MSLKSKLSVRDFVLDDKESIFQIILTTNNFNEKDKKVAIDLIETYIENRYDGSYVECLIKDGKVIGFIYYEEAPLCEGVFEIYYVAIAPDERGKGYGKLFFSDLETRLKKKGLRIMLLETSSIDEYIPTMKFYESIGYRAVGRIKDYYKSGDDKLTYEKRFI